MEQKQKSKQSLGTKRSERDVQFTSAIRKAEAKNCNETRNMKKSIDQLFKEHQQVMKNLKRERWHIVRRWNLRLQESTMTGGKESLRNDQVDQDKSAEESDTKDVEVREKRKWDVHFPHIKNKDNVQTNTQIAPSFFDANRSAATFKCIPQEREKILLLPQAVDKGTNERQSRDSRTTQAVPQNSDTRLPKPERNFSISAAKGNAASVALPSKRSRSISYESGLSVLNSPRKRLGRNLSIDALHESKPQPKTREDSDEMKSFFKTDLE